MPEARATVPRGAITTITRPGGRLTRQVATARLVASLAEFLDEQAALNRQWIEAQLMTRSTAGLQRGALRTVGLDVQRESTLERAFRKASMDRISAKLPAVLAKPIYSRQDRQERWDAINALLEPELRFARQRQEALSSRILRAVERAKVAQGSPEGAFWRLGPTRTHTPDCVAMADRFHPWPVLARVHPPLHPGCACTLHAKGVAVANGWMGPDDAPSLDAAIRHAAQAVPEGVAEEWLDELKVREALAELGFDTSLIPLAEAFTESKHPRDWRGRFQSLFHVTPDRHVAAIEREGLTPRGDRAAVTMVADPFSGTQPVKPSAVVPNTVYGFSRLADAGRWARKDSAVFGIKLQPDSRLVPDHEDLGARLTAIDARGPEDAADRKLSRLNVGKQSLPEWWAEHAGGADEHAQAVARLPEAVRHEAGVVLLHAGERVGVSGSVAPEHIERVPHARVRRSWPYTEMRPEPPPRAPAVKPWHEPPAPTGKTGERKGGGLTAVGVTNTKLGDAVEQALTALGFEDAHPGRRQGPFDLRFGDNAYEVKAVSQSASEYKAKPKKHEVDGKLAHARQHGLKPHVMIVVYEPGAQRVHAYVKEGVGAYRLTGPDQGWSYIGSVPLDLGGSADPVAALQEAVVDLLEGGSSGSADSV